MYTPRSFQENTEINAFFLTISVNSKAKLTQTAFLPAAVPRKELGSADCDTIYTNTTYLFLYTQSVDSNPFDFQCTFCIRRKLQFSPALFELLSDSFKIIELLFLHIILRV